MKPFAAIHYCAVGKHASIGRASIAVNKQPTFSFVKLLVKFRLHSVRVVFFHISAHIQGLHFRPQNSSGSLMSEDRGSGVYNVTIKTCPVQGSVLETVLGYVISIQSGSFTLKSLQLF